MAAKKSNPKAKAAKQKNPTPIVKAAKKVKLGKITTSPKATVAIAPVQNCLQLPERFDSSSAADALEFFRAHRGKPLVVDASGVRRVGAQSLQILVSAGRTWRADGLRLFVENPSPELLEAASLLGLPHAELSVEGSLQ